MIKGFSKSPSKKLISQNRNPGENTMNEKFELTKESKIAKDGTTKLFRIKCVKTFENKAVGQIKAGTVGGWIESLSTRKGFARVSGDAWVFGDAEVYGNARVSGDAWVFGNAEVSGDAWVFGNAWVSGDAEVSGDAWVFGNAEVFGNARVSGDARVYGNVKIDCVFCNMFSFEFDWQVELWKKKEKEYKEEVEQLKKNKKG